MAKRIDNIDLNGHIPPNAKSVKIKFACYTAEGKALLYRFSGDSSPVALHGPEGVVEVNIGVSRTLALEILDDSAWQIGVSGYSI
ncbi:hypothetical protein [Paraburkholderia bannensis]|uniref:hypothetical protein n=1 Tax=Paraburkholderia bannensis TaxID=765414 RepID=UPI0012EB56CA|nr:hypothetical protein [Paraburkholderia bannensis]